jgi:hypothetical protein
MILDSHIERRVVVYNNLGVPRWHKRIQYYIFKIRYLQYVNKKLTKIPNYKIRNKLSNEYFNEYEHWYNKDKYNYMQELQQGKLPSWMR